MALSAMVSSQPVRPEPPRVLLIGDSITFGYHPTVKAVLADTARVERIPINGRSTRLTLLNLESWLGNGKWAVVHFNWGLHDLRIMDSGQHQVPLEEYERNLDTLIRRLRQTGARLIFATTTPVPEGPVDPPRQPRDVLRYNEAALKVLARHPMIRIDDLYSHAVKRCVEQQIPANVHFKPEGYRCLGEHVAGAVREALRSNE